METATIVEEKDMTILCLNKNITSIETSKEVFQKQLLQKSAETTALSKTLKTEIDSGNNVTILSKINQDERIRLQELREKTETMNITENNKLVCSCQTKSYLKEDVKPITTSKESFTTQVLQLSDEISAFTVNLNNETELEMK